MISINLGKKSLCVCVYTIIQWPQCVYNIAKQNSSFYSTLNTEHTQPRMFCLLVGDGCYTYKDEKAWWYNTKYILSQGVKCMVIIFVEDVCTSVKIFLRNYGIDLWPSEYRVG